MEHFRESLIEKGIKQSMSRKGNCLDNLPIGGTTYSDLFIAKIQVHSQ